jgi:hypothetical protein
MSERSGAAVLALLFLACGPPQRSPYVKRAPAPSPAPGSDEARPDVSKLTPVILEPGVPIALPGTTLTATLVRSWRGERVVGEDQGVTAAAEVSLRAADGRSETVVIPFFRARTALGTRLYLDGTRDAIFLFVVPPSR